MVFLLEMKSVMTNTELGPALYSALALATGCKTYPGPVPSSDSSLRVEQLSHCSLREQRDAHLRPKGHCKIMSLYLMLSLILISLNNI